MKKQVLRELTVENTQSWCSEIKRSLPWGRGNCIGDAQPGTRPVLVTVQRIQQELHKWEPSRNPELSCRDLGTEQACCKDLACRWEKAVPPSASVTNTCWCFTQLHPVFSSWLPQITADPQTEWKRRSPINTERTTGDKSAQEKKPHMKLLLTWWLTTWTSRNAWWLKHRSQLSAAPPLPAPVLPNQGAVWAP